MANSSAAQQIGATDIAQAVKESPEEIATNILSILSQSAYTSFSHALREIISNAYDADARYVHIRTVNDGRSLRVSDDGVGMDRQGFRSRYARIAVPKQFTLAKRTKKFHRRPIGKFGIGHLAIAPTCSQARVVTSMGRGKQVFEAIMDYEEYLDPANLPKPLSEVYRYFAADLPENALQEFEGARAKAKGSFTIIELDDLKDEIAQELGRPGLSLVDQFESVSDLTGKARLEWELGVITPVPYVKGGPVSGYRDAVLTRIKRELEDAKFVVQLDAEPILRPIRLPAFGKKFKEPPKRGRNYQVYTFEETDSETGLKFRGYIFNQASQIVPRELRGILVRVRGVAIGLHRPDFLGAKTTSSVFRDSTTGEIYVDEGLDEAITLDRTNFKENDPAFVALRTWLSEFLKKVVAEYWERGRKRKVARIRRKRSAFEDRLSEGIADFFSGPAAPEGFSLVKGRVRGGRPCAVNTVTGEIRINPNHKLFKPFPVSGREREVLQICLYALEIARERSKGDADRFYAETLAVMEELLDSTFG